MWLLFSFCSCYSPLFLILYTLYKYVSYTKIQATSKMYDTKWMVWWIWYVKIFTIKLRHNLIYGYDCSFFVLIRRESRVQLSTPLKLHILFIVIINISTISQKKKYSRMLNTLHYHHVLCMGWQHWRTVLKNVWCLHISQPDPPCFHYALYTSSAYFHSETEDDVQEVDIYCYLFHTLPEDHVIYVRFLIMQAPQLHEKSESPSETLMKLPNTEKNQIHYLAFYCKRYAVRRTYKLLNYDP